MIIEPSLKDVGVETRRPSTLDEIVEEVMSLIGNMYYGRKEDKDFKRKIHAK